MARSRRPKRQRDYQAEYARRRAQGLAAGKSVRAARGHAAPSWAPPGASEYATRKERVRVKFGTTPARLTQLRKDAVAYVIAELTEAGTKGKINPDTIYEGMRRLNADQLEIVLQMDGPGMKVQASLDYGQGMFDDIQDDEEPDDYRNPYWYK